MGFEPDKNTEPRRAVRAGLIAIERGSRIIELADWMQAAKAPSRRPADDEYLKLKAMSVSDEVVMRVADDRARAQAAGEGGLAARLARLRTRQPPSSPPTDTDSGRTTP